jgi:large subunit ribosomal protein L22
MDVESVSKFVRLSPSKARDLARRMRGLGISDALKVTEFDPRKAARMIGKTLKSAVADAEHNADLSVDHLRVKDAVVEEGPRLKRWWPRARGSASPILKRTCHIRIVLTDETKA